MRENIKNILQWTQTEVQEWLTKHHLVQLSRLLSDCGGRSLVHFYKYMKAGERSLVMSLLQDDCIRRLNESISLIYRQK